MWTKEFPGGITVCDPEGRALEMNDRAAQTFAKDGGRALIGSNLLDCHPQPAKDKMAEMLKNPGVNCYTIGKNGVKKLIYQAPWWENGEFKGLVELSLEIPLEMPHYERAAPAEAKAAE